MDAREKIINAIEKAKKQSEEYAQERIIVPFKEADMIITMLKEQPEIIRCNDCKYYTGGIDGYCDRWFRRSGGNMAFCSEGERKKQTAE